MQVCKVFLIVFNIFVAHAVMDPKEIKYQEKKTFVPTLAELRDGIFSDNF